MGNHQSIRFLARFSYVLCQKGWIFVAIMGILRGKKNKTERVRIAVQNAPLPSDKSWLADRLASFYHKIGSISPSRPTLEELAKGVGLCLPQRFPNLLLCCLHPAHHTRVLSP
jgi:hypothetical protein